MGIRERLRRLFAPLPVEVVEYGHIMERLDDMSPGDMYEQQPALRTVTDFIARNIASLPLKCYERGDDGRRRVRDSALAMLLDRPNAHQTRYDFMVQTVV